MILFCSFFFFFFLFLMVLCFVSYLIDHLQAVPDDLKTKLSIDEDIVSSPKEALSRASAERVAWRNKNFRRYSLLILIACTYMLIIIEWRGAECPVCLSDIYISNRGMSHSYSNHGDKAVSELTGYSPNNLRFDDTRPDSAATLATQVLTSFLE